MLHESPDSELGLSALHGKSVSAPHGAQEGRDSRRAALREEMLMEQGGICSQLLGIIRFITPKRSRHSLVLNDGSALMGDVGLPCQSLSSRGSRSDILVAFGALPLGRGFFSDHFLAAATDNFPNSENHIAGGSNGRYLNDCTSSSLSSL